MLDEPTNDLDLPTLSVLENFLLEFGGCLIIVSHDRYFMDRLVDHLFVFEGEGEIRDFPGNYTQYREWQKLQQAEETAEKREVRAPEPPAAAKEEKRRLSYKEQREFDQLTKELAALEQERKEIYAQLENPELPYDELQRLTIRIGEVNEAIDTRELRWLELSEYE